MAEFETALAKFNQDQLNQIDNNAIEIKQSVEAIKNTDLSNVSLSVDQIKAVVDLIRSTDVVNIKEKNDQIKAVVDLIRSTDVVNIKEKNDQIKTVVDLIRSTDVVNIKEKNDQIKTVVDLIRSTDIVNLNKKIELVGPKRAYTSENISYESLEEVAYQGDSWGKLKEFIFPYEGTATIKFPVRTEGGSCYFRILKNGVLVGVQYPVSTVNYGTPYSYNSVVFSRNDIIRVEGYTSNGATIYIKDFRMYFDLRHDGVDLIREV